MVDFRALETFVSVAALGSFRGAAAKLNMTQPAISQRIAQLEDRLDAKLLERRSRAVGLTPAGRALLVYAEKLLRLRAEMMQALAERQGLSGVLRLGVSETIVHTWLARFIERLDKAHPLLALEIEV
ncbi:MAG TPA: LysR family transcriptional regulator, partial [Stellaceae bacterium]|nr:LysR family transcriptional regulator [Stellaceae bacterium]